MIHFLRVEFPPLRVTNKKRKKNGDEEAMVEKPMLEVTPYQILNRGPYPFNQPKK